MISRIAKQTEQDSDRHDDRDSASVRSDTRTEVKDNGTNKSLRDAQVPKMTSAKSSRNAPAETRKPPANAHDRRGALGPSNSKQPSDFFYFPVDYRFAPHYSHPYYRSNQHRRNKSYYYRRNYSHHHPYPPPPHSASTQNSMAPFDDTTLATSNISRKKEKLVKPPLTVDTNHAKNDMEHRSERYSRPYPPPYYTPSYGEYYRHPGPYHEDGMNRPHEPHFGFYDTDSTIDHEFPFSTTPIAIGTPQRSNASSRADARNRNGGNEEERHVHPRSNDAAHDDRQEAKWKYEHHTPGYYEHHPHYDHDREGKNRTPQGDRRQAYSSAYHHNGWYAPYEHPQEAYPPPQEPYDRHYFSPSPPPPPPSPYPDHFVPSSEAFVSRAASPSMSWYEGSRGSYDEQDAPVPFRVPVPHYYSHPNGGYRYPDHPPPEHEEKQRPGTPCPNEQIKSTPTVTPKKPTGRDSLPASNSEINIDQASSFSSDDKAIVTPGDKSGASTFAPSSPFVTLRDSDIVCGRGAPTNFHIGNSRFRELVLDYNKSYFVAKRSEKPRIAMKVLDVLSSRGARFVRRIKGGSSASSHWEEVAHKIAYEKVCQALRDAGGPSRQMLSSVAASSQKRKPIQSPMKENGGSNKRQKTAYQQGFVGTSGTRTGGEEGKENCAV